MTLQRQSADQFNHLHFLQNNNLRFFFFSFNQSFSELESFPFSLQFALFLPFFYLFIFSLTSTQKYSRKTF